MPPRPAERLPSITASFATHANCPRWYPLISSNLAGAAISVLLVEVWRPRLLFLSRRDYITACRPAKCGNCRRVLSSTAFPRFESYRRIIQPRPEERACARLEGRPQARPSQRPSFETALRASSG